MKNPDVLLHVEDPKLRGWRYAINTLQRAVSLCDHWATTKKTCGTTCGCEAKWPNKELLLNASYFFLLFFPFFKRWPEHLPGPQKQAPKVWNQLACFIIKEPSNRNQQVNEQQQWKVRILICRARYFIRTNTQSWLKCKLNRWRWESTAGHNRTTGSF